ncbi:MAG: NADH-quinone oxidoreductase subunit I, partial [Ignavibacteriaceae bacterium]|nr:NADH-quinone oxidoreductase subunit I [Ignavibacteriaceae bacterium]
MTKSTRPPKKRMKDLTFLEKAYFVEIIKGLSLTFRTMFKPKYTMEYPEEKYIPSGSYRGRPVLVLEENGK